MWYNEYIGGVKMKPKQYLISIFDGFFQGFCVIKLLLDYFLSQIARETSLQIDIVISCFVALLTATVSFLSIHKEPNNKNLLKLSSISFLCFVVSFPILVSLPFHIFPTRELDTVEGFLMISIFSFFLLTAAVVRSGILVGVMVRVKRKS